MAVGNNVTFIGRLTKDIELKSAGEYTVCNFTLARNRYTKDKEHPVADFVDCVAWNKTAEMISKFFHKGSRMGVMGDLQTRTYEDTNGVKRKVTEILVTNVEFIDTKAEAGATHDTTPAPATQRPVSTPVAEPQGDYELPF